MVAGLVALGGFGTAILSGWQDGTGLTPEPATTATTTTPAAAAPGGPPPGPGDLVMTTFPGTTATPALLRRVRLGRVAGVLLTGRNIAGPAQVRRLTSTLQSAAYAGGYPPLIIAVDQEGGTVKRLATFPPERSAADMGGLSTTTIRSEGRRTGVALRSVGINVDLAPVADVPSSATSFLGSRAFSPGPKRAAITACAFAEGLHEAGVRPTLKHFPGLGAATANTDDARVSIPFGPARLKRDLSAYRRCANNGDTLTMMSSARYPRLTGTRPAVLSPPAYTFARDIGARGPIITDSLSAEALVGEPDIGTRAVRAGADLLLYTSWGSSVAGYRELLRSTTRGRITAEQLADRALRVRAFRAELWTGR